MSQRVVFYNPHTHGLYWRSVYQILTKYPISDKLGYILKHQIENNRFYVYIDDCDSSVPRIPRSKILARLEFWLWCSLHKLKPTQIKLVKREELSEDDILVLTIKNLNDRSKPNLENLRCKKILNTNHFMTSAKKRALQVEQIGIDHYWCEADLSNNGFFQKYYGFGQKGSFIPYVPKDRFKNITPFDERLDRCLALGSVYCFGAEDSAVKELRDYFKVGTYHPVRQGFFDNWRELAPLVDVYVTPFKGNDHCLQAKNDPPVHAEDDYYKRDLVELMNRYKFVVYGEEVHGLPALGMYEALKCGCVILGSSSQVYSDIGLEADVSYLSFGQTVEPKRVLDVLRGALEDRAKLKSIAEHSTRIATENIGEALSRRRFDEMIDTVKSSR